MHLCFRFIWRFLFNLNTFINLLFFTIYKIFKRIIWCPLLGTIMNDLILLIFLYRVSLTLWSVLLTILFIFFFFTALFGRFIFATMLSIFRNFIVLTALAFHLLILLFQWFYIHFYHLKLFIFFVFLFHLITNCSIGRDLSLLALVNTIFLK